ncbi:MAG: undecaprenyl-phosphate galactose phosphotransferase WbaP [Selenomonadaceae bacterium]|nr:undecaprenyl-phosphate galactose phosphotransferase WbaP [Selenomonadaceae bacterium]
MNRLYTLCLIALDYLLLISAELVALFLRRDVIPGGENLDIPGVYLFIIVPSIFLAFLHASRIPLRQLPSWRIFQHSFWSVFYSVVTIALLLYFGKVGGDVSRLFAGLTGIFAFFFLSVGRYIFRELLNRLHFFETTVLFIGMGRTAELVLDSFNGMGGGGYRVLGFLDDNPKSRKLKRKYRVLGKFKHLERVIHLTKVKNVIITAPGLKNADLVDLVARVRPLVENVAFVPDFVGAPVENLVAESLGESGVIFLRVKNNLAKAYNRAFKRLFDLILTLSGMVFVLPIGILICLLIRLDSKGPVIFSHRRIGQNGKEFNCYKFRSMVVDSEKVLKELLANDPAAKEEWEREFKLKDDPRITKIGRFLRKTSLDELPQLINVLKGEMSLVGPRPIVEAEIAKYGEYFADFCLVPPGMTGVWQVNGRSDTTYPERVQMDSWYVKNWSPWIDIIYLIKTFAVVIKGKGAY